jgi:hypothetical protein
MDLHPVNDLGRQIAELATRRGSELDVYPDPASRLFAVIVCATDLYVRAVCGDAGEMGTTLAAAAVDRAALADPASWQDFEALQYRTHLQLTAQSIVENLTG